MLTTLRSSGASDRLSRFNGWLGSTSTTMPSWRSVNDCHQIVMGSRPGRPWATIGRHGPATFDNAERHFPKSTLSKPFPGAPSFINTSFVPFLTADAGVTMPLPVLLVLFEESNGGMLTVGKSLQCQALEFWDSCHFFYIAKVRIYLRWWEQVEHTCHSRALQLEGCPILLIDKVSTWMIVVQIQWGRVKKLRLGCWLCIWPSNGKPKNKDCRNNPL